MAKGFDPKNESEYWEDHLTVKQKYLLEDARHICSNESYIHANNYEILIVRMAEMLDEYYRQLR